MNFKISMARCIDIFAIIVGISILYYLTPINYIMYFFNSGYVFRATDLEVAFNYENYFSGTLFEKSLGMIGYIFKDYGSISVATLIVPLILTFFIGYLLSKIYYFHDSNRSFMTSSFSLLFALTITLNPFFIKWFSLPYMFFYPLVVLYIIILFIIFEALKLKIHESLALFFISTLIIYAIFWDISFQFIPFMFIIAIFMILISSLANKYKNYFLILLILATVLSTIASLNTVPYLFSKDKNSVFEESMMTEDFWNIFKLNIYLSDIVPNNTVIEIIAGIFPFLVIPFIFYRHNRRMLLIYIFGLSMPYISYIMFTIMHNGQSSTLIEISGILRRPERPLLFTWIITWLIIYKVVITSISKKESKKLIYVRYAVLGIFILLFSSSVIFQTVEARHTIIEENLRPISREIFLGYLNFLEYSNNVTYGYAYILPFYSNIAADNRLNYRESIFYRSSYSKNNDYPIFIKIINQTYGKNAESYEQIGILKEFIIGIKLFNISKIGIISPRFGENEFQNWRLRGSPKTVYSFVRGDPDIFINKTEYQLSSLKNYFNNETLIKMENYNGYTILDFSRYIYENCKVYVPQKIYEGDTFETIRYISDSIPDSALLNISYCKNIKLDKNIELDKNGPDITIYFGNSTYSVTKYYENLKLDANNFLLFKNITIANDVLNIEGNFGLWYIIDKDILSPYRQDDILCVRTSYIRGNITNSWIRILDTDGKLVYPVYGECYSIGNLRSSAEKYIAISGTSENNTMARLRIELMYFKENFQRVDSYERKT